MKLFFTVAKEEKDPSLGIPGENFRISVGRKWLYGAPTGILENWVEVSADLSEDSSADFMKAYATYRWRQEPGTDVYLRLVWNTAHGFLTTALDNQFLFRLERGTRDELTALFAPTIGKLLLVG